MTRKNIPKVLALVSLLLLSVFVVFWNYKEYQNEKVVLKDALTAQLQLAESEVKEAHLWSDIVLFIKDEYGEEGPKPSALKDKMWTFIDSTQGQFHDHKLVSGNNHDCDSIKTNYFTNLRYTAKIDCLVVNDDGTTKWTNTSLDSALAASKQSDNIVQKLTFRSPKRDSNTYQLYKEKLKQNNLPTRFLITTKESITPKSGMRIEYLSSGFSGTQYAVDTKGYTFYLFKKILPTLFFSLLLLGIVALAFYSLLKNIAQQQTLVRTKNEFINNMTHELKTPISTVAVALEAISDFGIANEPDKAQEYIDISKKEVDKLSMLVDKVLKIATSDRQNQNYEMKSIDLSKITSDALESLQLAIAQKNANVQFTSNVEQAVIEGDKLHISNAIVNIIDNALKYNNNVPTIEVELTDSEKNLKLRIKDNGIGISNENQKKIFQRFFRVPTGDQHDVKGHGLGLSYVNDVVKKHNGRLSLESAVGIGSIFTITLQKSNN